MPLKTVKHGWLFASLIFFFSFTGCAGRTYLFVDYQVPAVSQTLKGQVVRLRVEDQRKTRQTMSPGAAYQFPEFSGIYSLAFIMPDQSRVLGGEHRLEELFKAAFKKRLEENGVVTTDDSSATVPDLTVTLKQFDLDLKNHKWMVGLTYDAVLTMPDHPIARENVSGSAERVRVIGSKGADTVFSEIFSDAINRLDLIKLFRNAELIK